MVFCDVYRSRIIVYGFAGGCFIAGLILFGMGIDVVSKHITDYYAGNLYNVGIAVIRVFAPGVPIASIILGIVVIVFACIGLFGAFRENTWLLLSFFITILILLLVQIGFGLHGLINHDALIEKCLTATLNGGKDQAILRNAFIATQENHQCCGVNKPIDWEPILGNKNLLILPSTCCEWSFGKECTVKNAIKDGCHMKMSQYVKKYYIPWFAVAFTLIILLEIIGIWFTWVLLSVYRKRDPSVIKVLNRLRSRF